MVLQHISTILPDPYINRSKQVQEIYLVLQKHNI